MLGGLFKHFVLPPFIAIHGPPWLEGWQMVKVNTLISSPIIFFCIVYVYILISISLFPVDQLCPPGWLGSIDSKFCYYYDPSQLNFDSAVQRCRDKNATLVQPQDSLQNNLISIFFMDMNPYSQQNGSVL